MMVGDVIVFDDGGVEFAKFFVVFGWVGFGCLWLFSNEGFSCDARVLEDLIVLSILKVWRRRSKNRWPPRARRCCSI